jgi:hypothetical protein
MTEPVLISLIGFGGAIVGALLVAFLQPIWVKIISKASNLDVKVSYYSFSLPWLLETSIDEYIGNDKLNIKPTKEQREFLYKIKRSSGTGRITITNNSKRAIEGIVARCKHSDEIILDVSVDSDIRKTALSKSCDIGVLRPNSTCIVNFWTTVDYAESAGAFRDAIEISANEYDRIKITYPLPYYLEKKRNDKKNSGFQ